MQLTWLSKASTALKRTNLHEWIKSLAIIAAGSWTVFTFTPRTPSQPDLSLSISQNPEASTTPTEQQNKNSPEYSRLELVAKFTNPSSRTLWLTPTMVMATGIRVTKGQRRELPSLKPGNLKFVPMDDEGLAESVNYYGATYELYAIRNLPIPSRIPAGSSISTSVILPTPKDRYQGVWIYVVIPRAHKKLDDLSLSLSIAENGMPRLAMCRIETGDQCQLLTMREQDKADLEMSVQTIQAWLQ